MRRFFRKLNRGALLALLVLIMLLIAGQVQVAYYRPGMRRAHQALAQALDIQAALIQEIIAGEVQTDDSLTALALQARTQLAPLFDVKDSLPPTTSWDEWRFMAWAQPFPGMPAAPNPPIAARVAAMEDFISACIQDTLMLFFGADDQYRDDFYGFSALEGAFEWDSDDEAGVYILPANAKGCTVTVAQDNFAHGWWRVDGEGHFDSMWATVFTVQRGGRTVAEITGAPSAQFALTNSGAVLDALTLSLQSYPLDLGFYQPSAPTAPGPSLPGKCTPTPDAFTATPALSPSVQESPLPTGEVRP